MNHKKIFSLFFIISLVFLAYGNTFSAFWRFDDYHNILNNQNTHLESFTFENIKKSFTLDNSRNIFRALPRFSLAINWYFDKEDVFGYHLFNTIIHCITTFALFLLTYHLLSVVYPNRKQNYDTAILSALIWALHPIQISAVTYIVQRMASMAAMFYILSMLFYIQGRIRSITKSKPEYYFFLLSALFFIFAIFSKENAIMLPVSLLLIEIVIFQNRWILKNKIALFKGLFLLGSLLLFFLVYFFPDSFFNLFVYEIRFFNCFQRVLTEFRVLIFYLSLILFPVTSRFSLEHYFQFSTSLINPLTTFFSLFMIIFFLMIAFISRKKYPLLSFALFFYFLNHVVESTFIGLELAYEHRNYLPSIFLFLPLVLFLQSLMLRNKKLMIFIASLICLVIIVLGISTHNRNYVWNDIGLLWEDALSKSPESGRVLLNYAMTNLFEAGKYNETLKCFFAATNMEWHRKKNKKGVPYNKISKLLEDREKYLLAMEYAGKALVQKPENEEYMRELMLLQLRNESYDAADLTCDLLLGLNPTNPDFLNDKGFIFLKKRKPRISLTYFKRSLEQKPLNRNALFYAGYARYQLGHYKQSDILLNIARSYYRDDPEILYLLLSNSLINKNKRSMYYYNMLLIEYPIPIIHNDLNRRQRNPMALKLDEASLLNFLNLKITGFELKNK